MAKENIPPIQQPEKVLPQNLAFEQLVLGQLMLCSNSDAWAKVSGFLKPEMFFSDKHRIIFGTIKLLAAAGEPMDFVSVDEKARSMGFADGQFKSYLTELIGKVASDANIEYYARIIHQKWIGREIVRIGDGLSQSAMKGDDPLALLETSKKQLLELTPKTGQRLVSGVELWPDVAKDIEKAMQRFKSGTYLAGVPSGLHALDRLTLGWMQKEYYLFAGRPAMGKTAFMLALAKAAGMAGHPVHITSLEMGAKSLLKRMAAYDTGISTWRMRRGDITIEEFRMLNDAADRLLKNIHIEDGSARDIDSIYNSCYGFSLDKKNQTDKHPVFMLDYAQLTDVDSKTARETMNREQVISRVSRGWKAICKDMDAPGIALSQLSRATESRAGDKKPMMSDLRESGSLEQDADLIGFLYRPEYYKIDTYEDGSQTKGTGQILIPKYREGETGECLLGWSGAAGWKNLGDDDSRYPKIQPKDITISNSEREHENSGGGDFFPF